MQSKLMRLIHQRWGSGRIEGSDERKIVVRQLTPLAQSCTQKVSMRKDITVSAKEPHQLFSVAACLEVALRAGHIKDFCGSIEPLFSMRWLQWPLEFLQQVDKTPDALSELYRAAGQALEMGYNALFIGEGFGYRRPDHLFDQQQFLKLVSLGCLVAEQMDMRIGIDITRFEVRDKRLLKQLFSDRRISFAFHANLEATFGRREGLLRDEKLLLGINRLKDVCEKRISIVAHLIDDHFGDQKTLTALMARLPSNCHLSFCAIGQNPDQIYGVPHPIWRMLRSLPVRGSLPLIPVFNPGQTGWGEGLWPILPVLEWNGLLQRAAKENLTSVLSLCPRLPRGNGFLHASLWIFGQAQWHSLNTYELWNTWCKGHRPHWKIPQRAKEQLLQLSKSLQRLLTCKSNGCDLYDIMALKAEIALLSLRLPHMIEGELLLEAIHLFLVDARHLLIAGLQEGIGAHQGTQYHALLQTLLQEDGNEMGIWTEMRGSGAGAKMGWRHAPLISGHKRADQIASEGGFDIGTRDL